MNYEQIFLDPAHPYRWGREPFSIPRIPNSFEQVNTNEEIKCGHKSGYPLVNLRAPGKGRRSRRFKNRFCLNIERRDGDRRKWWVFVSYDDATPIQFLMFDLDRHYSPFMLPSEAKEIDRYVQEQVIIIEQLAREAGGSVVWTTSPGDFYEGYGHIQGLYAWIPLDRPVPFGKLKNDVVALKDYWGIEAESFDTIRMIRLPGQRHVEVCDPRTYKVIDPVSDEPIHSFEVFAREWVVR